MPLHDQGGLNSHYEISVTPEKSVGPRDSFPGPLCLLHLLPFYYIIGCCMGSSLAHSASLLPLIVLWK
jgi:hypothetical protein